MLLSNENFDKRTVAVRGIHSASLLRGKATLMDISPREQFTDKLVAPQIDLGNEYLRDRWICFDFQGVARVPRIR